MKPPYHQTATAATPAPTPSLSFSYAFRPDTRYSCPATVMASTGSEKYPALWNWSKKYPFPGNSYGIISPRMPCLTSAGACYNTTIIQKKTNHKVCLFIFYARSINVTVYTCGANCNMMHTNCEKRAIWRLRPSQNCIESNFDFAGYYPLNCNQSIPSNLLQLIFFRILIFKPYKPHIRHNNRQNRHYRYNYSQGYKQRILPKEKRN